jgi:tetratricopeptide (TPR) repeat protein
MNTKVRMRSLATVMCVVGTIVLRLGEPCVAAESPRSEKQAMGNSVARYATGDFFAACCVRPKGLSASPLFGSLPLYIFVPDPVSLERLDSIGIEELAVFCACPDESHAKAGRPAALRWAAAARASKNIDLEDLLARWHHAIVPKDKGPRAKPVALEIEGHQCFRVPAGSFFEPSRTYGVLRFTDRTGKPTDKGISIGRANPRRYAEGATKSSAVFTFDHIDESDLGDGWLPLEIYPDVFETYFLGKNYSLAQIELRNPDTGLRSEPITFQPESYVNHHLDVPNNLTAVDGNGKRAANLLKDFVSGGRIEVILKGAAHAVYIGVGPQDLYLQHKAFEYVYVSGREIVVAQSPERLQQMLHAAQSPVPLANRLARSADDVVIVASLSDSSRRIACQRLVSGIDDELGVDLLGDGWTDMTATVKTQPSLACQITASFADSLSASQAASHFKQLLRTTKAHARAHIKELLNIGDCLGTLTSLAFGVSTNFPLGSSETLKLRDSQLFSLINDALDNIRTDTDDKRLTVRFTQPENLVHLLNEAQAALANIDEAFARDLLERDRHDLSFEMYRRVTDRFPHAPESWFRRAHHVAYNMSVKFTHLEDRYAWVRQGVMVLLDGAEQNPDNTDLMWMAARFIGWKIGASDERAAYRQLFSQDKILQQRLAKLIDLEKARSPDLAVDNWLVTKLMIQDCVNRQKPGEQSTISAWQSVSRLPAAQAKYAESLSESGHWDEARQAWKEAEQLYKELANRKIVLWWNLQSVRLDELKSRLAESGPNDAMVQFLQRTRGVVQYDYWLARCELEQTEKMQLVRKLSQEAAINARQSKPKQAHALYRQSLEALAEIYKQHPRQMVLMAGDLKPVAEGYRKVAAAPTGSDERPLAPILTLIEGAKPISRNPSFFDANGG